MKKHYIYVFILLIVSMVFLLACEDGDRDLEIHDLIESGELDQAKDRLVERFEKSDGKDLDSYKLLLKLYYDQDMLEDFSNLYGKYKDLISDGETHYLGAKYYEKIGDIDSYKEEISSIDIAHVSRLSILEELAGFYLDKDWSLYERVVNKAMEYLEDRPSILVGHKYILDNLDKNIQVNGIEEGYFLDNEKKQVVVLMSNTYENNRDNYYKFVILDSTSGDLLKEFKEENVFQNIALRKLELSKEGDLDLLGFYGYMDREDVPGQLYIYHTNKNKVKNINSQLEGDWNAEVRDGFTIHIYSKNLAKNYLVDLDEKYQVDYIKDGNYSLDASLISSGDIGRGQEYIDTQVDREMGRVQVIKEISLYGKYDYDDYIAHITTIYDYKDGKWTIADLLVRDKDKDLVGTIEEESIEALILDRKAQAGDKLHKRSNLNLIVDHYGDILASDKNSLRKKMGSGRQVERTMEDIEAYKDFFIEYDKLGQVKGLTLYMDKLSSSLSMDSSLMEKEDLINFFGNPDYRFGQNESISLIREGFLYNLGDYSIIFGNGEEDIKYLTIRSTK